VSIRIPDGHALATGLVLLQARPKSCQRYCRQVLPTDVLSFGAASKFGFRAAAEEEHSIDPTGPSIKGAHQHDGPDSKCGIHFILLSHFYLLFNL